MHRIKAAVWAFFAWTARACITEENPARTIQLHRLKRQPPRFLTTAEKKRLLKILKGQAGFTALRDRVMIEVLLGTGTYRQPKFTPTLWTADWKKPSSGFSPLSTAGYCKRPLTGPLACCIFVLTM